MKQKLTLMKKDYNFTDGLSTSKEHISYVDTRDTSADLQMVFFIKNLKPQHYRGYDDNVYPQYFVKKEKI